MDCVLSPTPDGRGYCPLCDPGGSRPIPLDARRNCRRPDLVQRERRTRHAAILEKRHTPASRPWLEIEAILDACAAANLWPCARDPLRLEEWLDDVLDPNVWRAEWGVSL